MKKAIFSFCLIMLYRKFSKLRNKKKFFSNCFQIIKGAWLSIFLMPVLKPVFGTITWSLKIKVSTNWNKICSPIHFIIRNLSDDLKKWLLTLFGLTRKIDFFLISRSLGNIRNIEIRMVQILNHFVQTISKNFNVWFQK